MLHQKLLIKRGLTPHKIEKIKKTITVEHHQFGNSFNSTKQQKYSREDNDCENTINR